MNKILAGLFIFLFLSSSTYSEELFSYRGIQIGSNIKDIRACASKDDSNGICKIEEYPIGGLKIRNCEVNNLKEIDVPDSYTKVDFDDNGVIYGITNFSNAFYGGEHFYQKMKPLLLKKYGKPRVDGSNIMQNKFGAKFTRKITTWRTKQVEIYLTNFMNAELGYCSVTDLKHVFQEPKMNEKKSLENL